MSKGELWNILPYSGGPWGESPQCGVRRDLETPLLNKVKLVGIPFTGDNSGANPNLRLITFYADTLKGPISTTGPRSTFFRDYLNYKISWKIESFGDCKLSAVQIGFYTQSYTLNSPGPDNMLLMLAREGPTLYEANDCNSYRGCFETSEFTDMYVVVDADVIVKLKIASSLPEELETPCFTELFKKYKYVSKCGVLMATQMLINDQTGDTVIEPAKKYVNTAKKMIDYLFATSVDILLFETPTANTLSVNKKLLAEDVARLVVFFPYGNLKSIPLQKSGFGWLNYYIVTSSWLVISNGGQDGDGWGFTLFPFFNEILFKVHYKISIYFPVPTSTFSDTKSFSGFIEVGKSRGLGWDGYNNGLQPISSTFVGDTVELSGILEPSERPSFAGLKVGFNTLPRKSATPQISLLYFAIEFFGPVL